MGQVPRVQLPTWQVVREGGKIQGRTKIGVYVVSSNGHQDRGTLKSIESGEPSTRLSIIEVGEDVTGRAN